jgi:hypothetical protein
MQICVDDINNNVDDVSGGITFPSLSAFSFSPPAAGPLRGGKMELMPTDKRKSPLV